MKTKILQIVFLVVASIFLATTLEAQSSCYFYLRDANYYGYSYSAYINVWDNDLGSWVSPTWDGPTTVYPNQNNNLNTSLKVPVDSEYPRWIIVVRVEKNTTPPTTQYGYSNLLTTDEYLAGNVPVSQINF